MTEPERSGSEQIRCRSVRCVIVLPTYNEAENIGSFLRSVRVAAPDAFVLVVDDNSPDGTGALAEQAAADLGSIKVLHREGKLGLGAAYRSGFAVAFDEGYDVVVSMDSDFSHDPGVIPAMLRCIADGADVVVGSRYVSGGGTVNWPIHRRLLSKWGNRYTGFALRLHVSDITSGFRAYRASALQAVNPASTNAEGYAFLTELLRKLASNGASIVEVPITFKDRELGTSKMSGRIVAESMLLVTRWGIRDRFRRSRSRA